MKSEALAHVAEALDHQVDDFVGLEVDLFSVKMGIDCLSVGLAKHIFGPLVFHGERIELHLLVEFGAKVQGLEQPQGNPVVEQ